MAVLRVPALKLELLLITGKAELVELRAEEERYKTGADPGGVDWVSSHPPMGLKCRQ